MQVKSMLYEMAYSDGFFFAIQRLRDLLCGSTAFQGFTKKQLEAFMRGAFEALVISEQQRELLRTEPCLRISCKIDKNNKKNPMSDFKLERR